MPCVVVGMLPNQRAGARIAIDRLGRDRRLALHLGDFMPAIALSYRRFLHVILSILAGLLALTALKERVLADQTHTFVIPADEGYGVGDCLGKDQTCAQVVAAAWCESHGLAGPLSYGRAEDMTGTVANSPEPKIDPHAFIVTCKD